MSAHKLPRMFLEVWTGNVERLRRPAESVEVRIMAQRRGALEVVLTAQSNVVVVDGKEQHYLAVNIDGTTHTIPLGGKP